MGSILFSVLFLVMGYFFLFVAAWAAWGIYKLVLSNEQSRKYLDSGHDEPLQIDHLSGPLRSLAVDTRLLRVSLEAPARDIAEFVHGDLDRSADDVEAFDTMLMNISRQLTDWLMTIDRLPESERLRLNDIGVSVEPIRSVLSHEGWAFERRNLVREGMPPMDARLRNVMAELAKIEHTLQLPASPYR